MPTVQGLPNLQNMAIRLSALEVSIYRESLLSHEPKPQQQIAKLAREEFASGKQHDKVLVNMIQVKAEQELVLKKEMESQARQQEKGKDISRIL